MLNRIHQPQLNFKLPHIINLNACGVASIVQTLNYFEIPYESPEEVFYQFVKAGEYSLDYVTFEFEALPELPIPFTFVKPEGDPKRAIEETNGWTAENKIKEAFSVKIEKANSESYIPTFTLKYGSDSRGIVKFLEKQGLTVQMHEYIRGETEEEAFYKKLDEALNSGAVVMASVKKTEIPYLRKLAESIYGKDEEKLIGTHLLTLVRHKGKTLAVDPLVEEKSNAIKEVETEKLRKALTAGRKRGRFLAIRKP